MKTTIVAAMTFATATLLLAGCASTSANSTPVGIWRAPDGTTATINENGSCSNMYWTNGSSLDIGGGMSCSFSDSTLVVSQPPNEITYSYSIDGDTLTLNGDLVFTRQ